MTVVKFLYDANVLTGFCIEGHSTDNCDDIEGKTVCASVSSAAYMAANTVTDVIGDKADVKVSDGKMFFKVRNISDASNTVLEGFKLHITQLSCQYGKRLKITTEV